MDNIEKSRELMAQVLDLLRAERDDTGSIYGKRELSEALTHFETGCMFMIRSLFADKPYSPLTRLKPVEEVQ